MSEWFKFVAERAPELWLRTGEHILLVGAALIIAILIAIPLGICAHRVPRLRGPITGPVGVLQTIPSLAMLSLLLILLNRIGAVPALVALVLYALLPIVRNTLTGLDKLPPEVIEAANGIGMTRHQRLYMVDLPLAAPVIVTGIRTAAVVTVGIATLSTFIGAGGLGQFINRGLSLDNAQLILLGVIPCALLALLVDGLIGAIQWASLRRSSSTMPRWRERSAKIAAFSAPALLLAAGALAVFGPTLESSPETAARSGKTEGTITVGSKNFTEQLILGEILVQLIERETNLRVNRKFDLGGTMICHGALISGGIDLYPEYTGTALTAMLAADVIPDPDAAYSFVSTNYSQRFGIRWLKPFGFNNTYAITVRQHDATQRDLRNISDLAPYASTMRAGWTFEFSERPDGYPGLKKHYGFSFGNLRDLEASLMYEAIARKEIDVISAFATDGRIPAFKLKPLIDDRQFFPPYYAATIIRESVLAKHPELESILNLLAGTLSDTKMQELNYEVDQNKRSPAEVAREFLKTIKETVTTPPVSQGPSTGTASDQPAATK